MTSRFVVSYSFQDLFHGDEDAIRRALRDLSFGGAFSPPDVTSWSVAEPEPGRYVLSARRTVEQEIFETSARAALRKALYHPALPDDIDLARVRVVRENVAEPPLPFPARAA